MQASKLPIKSTLKLKALHNYNYKKESNYYSLSCPEPGKTVQSHKEECDINTIAYRFGLGHPIPQSVRLPHYGDFTGIDDYASALAAINDAEASFSAMPAKLREKFGNDPQNFVAFCSDSGNRQAAIDLGLIPRVPDPAGTPQTAPIAAVEGK